MTTILMPDIFVSQFASTTELVFEGLTRPSSLLMLRDDSADYEKYVHQKDDQAILERYFGDVQNLFLKKFALFAGSDQVSEQDSHKLRSLLEEMIKVKTLISKPAATPPDEPPAFLANQKG